MVFGKKIASSITVFGLFWICVFGQWHTVNAKGDDLPAVTYPEYISVWDDGTTTVDHPYNATTWFDESLGLWEDIFNDGRFNSFTWSDSNRASVEYVVSNFVSTNPQYTGVGTSYFDDIVDYIMANESQFGIYYTSFPKGNAWGEGNQAPFGDWWNMNFIYIPPEFVDALEDYIIDTYYTVSSGGSISINGNTWVATPFVLNNGYYVSPYTMSSPVVWYDWSVWCCRLSNGTIVFASWEVKTNTSVMMGAPRNSQQGFNSYGGVNSSYTYDGVTYRVGSYSNGASYYSNSLPVASYSSANAAYIDFYNNFELPSTEPVSNGDVYFRKDGINNSNYLQFSFPALPVQDSKSVSEYYYTTYGDTFEDSETVIDNSVYNYNTTTVYPITYTNDVPLWLVQRTVDTPSLEVVTADYSLPSVELDEGDASFWQGLYEALPVSVSVILLGVILCWLIFTLI